MDKDENIQSQIQQSEHDEHSMRNNDDVISIGNMSMSTLNNHEIKDYPTSNSKPRIEPKDRNRSKHSISSSKGKIQAVNNVFDYGLPEKQVERSAKALGNKKQSLPQMQLVNEFNDYDA